MESVSQMLQIHSSTFSFAVAFLATFLAGISDIRWYKIPNMLTFGLIVTGIVYHAVLPMGDGWLFSLAGFGFGFVVLAPLFALGGVGAGDVKLLAGIGSWVGLHDTVAIFLVFGILAATYSALVLIGGRWRMIASHRRHRPQSESGGVYSGLPMEQLLEQPERPRQLLPLAPILALSLLILAGLTIEPCDLGWNPFKI